MIEPLTDLPDNVLGFDAKGEVTGVRVFGSSELADAKAWASEG